MKMKKKNYKMDKKSSRGGARPGAGNPGTKRVEERRIQTSLTILPSVLNPFREKHGHKWSRKVEDMIKKENRHCKTN